MLCSLCCTSTTVCNHSVLQIVTEQHASCMQVRTLVQQALNKALVQHDLLLSPVAPTTAFKIGEKTEDPLAMYKEDLMTVHLNLAGKLVCDLYPRCITITGQVGRFVMLGVSLLH